MNNSKNHNCPFCEVLLQDSRNQIIKRGTYVTAIEKLYPSRNVNFLIISNSHLENLKQFKKDDHAELLSEIVEMANELSKNSAGTGDWSIAINNGKNSRQTVFHLHAHITSDEARELWFGQSRSNSFRKR